MLSLALAPPPPPLLLAALPACMRTFIVSSGWMVLCEAARAIAPATTSCAGFWSGCGGGGGGAAGAPAAATDVAVMVAAALLLLALAAAADTALSLPVGCGRVAGGST